MCVSLHWKHSAKSVENGQLPLLRSALNPTILIWQTEPSAHKGILLILPLHNPSSSHYVPPMWIGDVKQQQRSGNKEIPMFWNTWNGRRLEMINPLCLKQRWLHSANWQRRKPLLVLLHSPKTPSDGKPPVVHLRVCLHHSLSMLPADSHIPPRKFVAL